MAATLLSYAVAALKQWAHGLQTGHALKTVEFDGRVVELSCQQCPVIFWERGR